MTSSLIPQLVVVVLCAILIMSGTVWAQNARLLTSFGPCTERLLDYRPTWVSTSHSAGDPRAIISVLSPEQPFVRFYRMNDQGAIADAGTCTLPEPQQELVAAEVPGGSAAEYFTLSRHGNVVTVLRPVGPAFEQHVLRFQGHAQHIAIADINNDGHEDILLFGRTMAGVATFLGKPDGSFDEGPILFPEIPVSDLATADLNGDGITDVVLLDWLSNRLMIFNGISRGIFSEQVTIDLPGEPGALSLGPVTRERTVNIAVSLPQERQIALITADAAGEMEIDNTVDCMGTPLGVVLARINEDPWLDMMVPTDKGVMIFTGTPDGEPGPVSIFGPGTDCASWALDDLDGDRRLDAVFADNEHRKLIVLGNAEHLGRVPWPITYAVGPGPSGITIGDFDGDSRQDICVANSASSTLSFLLNKGNGRMHGQISVSVPENPEMATLVQRPRSHSQTLITSHPAAEKLGVLSLNGNFPKSESFAIPTGSLPSVLFAREDETSGGLVVLTRNTISSNGAKSLSLFEEIGSGQFLERSLKANLPLRILALTVDNFFGKNNFDMAFVTNDRVTKLSTVYLANGSPDFAFGHIHPVFTFNDSLTSSVSLLSRRIDHDPYPDLILVVGPPRNAIAIAYGGGDGTFRDSLQWIEGVHPVHDDALIIQDVNGDGLNDIVLLDDVHNAIVLLAGTADGRFSGPSIIAHGAGVTGIAAASFRRPDELDLILSHGEEGTVQIVFDAFKRSGR